jgi:hypothetical protein
MIGGPLEFIVVSVPAIIIAELLIRSSPQWFVAMLAIPYFRFINHIKQ